MYSKESLRLTLKMMGFKYQKDNNRAYLMEQLHIKNMRIKFLREYMKLKTEFDMVFIDETWVFSKGGSRKSWQDGTAATSKPKSGEGTR